MQSISKQACLWKIKPWEKNYFQEWSTIKSFQASHFSSGSENSYYTWSKLYKSEKKTHVRPRYKGFNTCIFSTLTHNYFLLIIADLGLSVSLQFFNIT